MQVQLVSWDRVILLSWLQPSCHLHWDRDAHVACSWTYVAHRCLSPSFGFHHHQNPMLRNGEAGYEHRGERYFLIWHQLFFSNLLRNWPALGGLCSVDNMESVKRKRSQLQDFHDISSLQILPHMKQHTHWQWRGPTHPTLLCLLTCFILPPKFSEETQWGKKNQASKFIFCTGDRLESWWCLFIS